MTDNPTEKLKKLLKDLEEEQKEYQFHIDFDIIHELTRKELFERIKFLQVQIDLIKKEFEN